MRGGEAPRSDIRDVTHYRQPKLFYGRYYSFRRIHLITVVRSFGSVKIIDQQSSKPSFNPPSHQSSPPLSPRIAHVLPTAVSTVGPAARSEHEHHDEPAHRRQEPHTSRLLSYVLLTRSGLGGLVEPRMGMPWRFLCSGFWNGLRDYLNSWGPDSVMFLLRSSGEVRATLPLRPFRYPLTPNLTTNAYGRL